MKFERVITINKTEAANINRYLTVEPEGWSDCLGEDETISYSANFPNNVEIEVKCCGVQFEEGESNLAWTEAVLFVDGCEICCTDPMDSFFGEWFFDFDGNTYTVYVEVEKTTEDIIEDLKNQVSELKNQIIKRDKLFLNVLSDIKDAIVHNVPHRTDNFELIDVIDALNEVAKVIDKDLSIPIKADKITREMVVKGYETGLIRLILSPNGDGIACKIGDNWFYFGGQTAEEYNRVEDFVAEIPKDTIIDEIFEVLEAFSEENDGLDEHWYYKYYLDEYLYYKYYLEENLGKRRFIRECLATKDILGLWEITNGTEKCYRITDDGSGVCNSIEEMSNYFKGGETALVDEIIKRGNKVFFESDVGTATYDEYLEQFAVYEDGGCPEHPVYPYIDFETYEKAKEIWDLLEEDFVL